MGWFVQKYAPWQREYNRVLRQVRDMGFNYKFVHGPISIQSRQKWRAIAVSNQQALTMAHVSVQYFIFIVGIVLSSIVFLVEYIMALKAQ